MAGAAADFVRVKAENWLVRTKATIVLGIDSSDANTFFPDACPRTQ